ncbi:zinc knuckle, partial [Ostertagia ostertagi]
MSWIGQGYGDNCLCSHRQSPVSTLPSRDDKDGSVSQNLLTYLRSMACADPGVFSGERNENFEEFVRRFKRKYEKVIGCEATLIEIFGDDHLGGRAKSVFTALPQRTKERGLDFVIGELARLLSQESTAGRLRALTELRNLKMRPGQEALENLGKQANPDCTIEERSLEYAQILLDNLSDWPEHFQLVGALHRVDARKAYEEVKQLALSIEQSKLVFGVSRRSSVGHWKNRAAQYRSHGGMNMSEKAQFTHVGVENVSEEGARIYENDGRNNYRTGSRIRKESQEQIRYSEADELDSSRSVADNRKCYKCLRYGHIARNCPLSAIRVNQVREQGSAEKKTLSEIINQARSLGMVAQDIGKATELVGNRIVKQLNLLGGRHPVLIDTGSMISVIPVETLAKAQDEGMNLDALKLVKESQLAPVFDASDNRMRFFGAVYIETELEGGNRALVPFHISPSKGDMIILGTNALRKLGVKLSIVADRKESSKQWTEREDESNATVVRRMHVPTRGAAWVHAHDYRKSSAEVGERWISGGSVAHEGYTVKNLMVSPPSRKRRANAGRRRTRKNGERLPKVVYEPVREAASTICKAHR